MERWYEVAQRSIFLITWLVFLAWLAPILSHPVGIHYQVCGPKGPLWIKKALRKFQGFSVYLPETRDKGQPNSLLHRDKVIVLTTWRELANYLCLGINLFLAVEALKSLILLPPIFTEFFPLVSFLTTVKQTLSSSLKFCLCLSYIINGILQCWLLRKWDRKHCKKIKFFSQ